MTKKAKKITTEELENIQRLTKVSNDIIFQIGVATVRKDGLTNDHDKVMAELDTFKKDLNKTYGDVNIDIKDGTLSPLEKVEEPVVEEVK